MELKGCSQVHFIQAIRRGFVTRILNIDSREKPALMFKKIQAIYEYEDTRNLGSCSTLQPQEGGYNVLPFGCSKYHVERSCLPVGGRRIIKSDPGIYKFSYDGGDNKRNIDWDDISFGETTLKQLRERCKTKKRKLSESVDLTKQDPETCSKQDHDNLDPKEDEFDLEEPLSSLKLKIPKKMKAKQKCIMKCVSSSSKTDVSVVETELIQSASQGSLETNGDLPGPINIEIEITELDFSNCENVVCVSDVSISDCHDKIDFRGDVYDEVSKRINGSELETRDSISIAKESPCCVVNEISYEYLEHVEPISLLPVNASVWGTMKDGFPEMTSHESFLISVSKFKEDIACPLPCDSPPEAISLTTALGSEMHGSCERYSFLQEEVSCLMNSNSGIQRPDMAIHSSLQCKELNNGGDGSTFEDDNKEDPPDLEANAIINSVGSYISSQNSHWLDPNGHFDSTDDRSTTTEEKHSSLTTVRPVSACVDGARDCSAGSLSSDATDGFTAMEILESHNHPKLEEHHPKKLFSTRKALSPASREKLCQAVDANELHENIEHYSLEGAEITINPEKIIRKPNNVKNGSLQFVPKGILKGPHVSRTIPPAGTKCTSIQSRSLKAIAFSQRQMHDIECLAIKLTKELKSMKDIVEETLRFEAFPSTSLKFKADEIRTAVSNAVEVEETTRKWLLMMAKDCNRFCKIMSKTLNASSNGVHKERKKITFADEAGRMLCHVKVLEDSPASILGSKCEKPLTKI